MKLKLAYLLIVLGFAVTAQGQSVLVTGKKVLYHRPKPMADFKKTFTVNYPKVKAATPALSRKIEDSISFDRNLPLRLREQMLDEQWLDEAEYEVIYNKNGALAVTLSVEGSGAYPDGSRRTVVVDARTGVRVSPATQFQSLSGLVDILQHRLQQEITAAIAEIKKDPDAQDVNPQQLFAGKKFGSKDLNGFSISDDGVTFTYEYGFPHAVQALEPEGRFTVAWAEIKPFLKPGSLLARLAR